jgi:hypothetical protein
MLGANLLESLFVLSFNHQNPQLGLIALTVSFHACRVEIFERKTHQLDHLLCNNSKGNAWFRLKNKKPIILYP